MRERVEPRELLVNGLREGKGIELRPERAELSDLDGIGLRAGLDALEGRLWAIIHAPNPSPHAGFRPCSAAYLPSQ